MHTGSAEDKPMTSCLSSIVLLIKNLFKNNTDTFPAGYGGRIENALPIRNPRGHTCLWDFAKSLHAYANDIDVARTKNKTRVNMHNVACKAAYPKTVQQQCPTIMK